MSENDLVLEASAATSGNESLAAHKILRKAAGVIGAEEVEIECELKQPFLEYLKGPEDIRKLPTALLPKLAQEIRERIHQSVSQLSGHLSSNLGVTELTIALHRIFDFSKDRLVLDVGHQVYPHKMLTGRAGRFHTLKQENGLCGYPDFHEDPVYDLFLTSHGGCAVSSTLGLSIADRKLGRQNHHVAVLGDGALTAGLSFEALNHAGASKSDILVIFNDNGCSIDVATGALANTCSRIRRTVPFKYMRRKGKELLESIPYVGKSAEKFAEGVFGAASHLTHSPGAIFMDLGFQYFGPIDGHDFEQLHEWLEEMKNTKGPKLLHVITKKGLGFKWSEEDPYTYHGAPKYKVAGETAIVVKSDKPKPKDYYQIVSETIVELANEDEKILAITAAMPQGTGLSIFKEAHPERYFDVGMCEQHAVCFSAALAKSGMKPVACIYSTFLQRAMDQLMHDISLQEGLPVVVCMDRAGLCGNDGSTANGVFDISYMRSLPFFILCAPKDGVEARAMVRWAVKQNKPVGIRTPKEADPSELFTGTMCPIELGKGEILKQGEKIAVLAYGAMVARAMKAAQVLEKEGYNLTIANARFVKPLDEELIAKLLNEHDHVITIEDHQLQNGFGSAVLEAANALKLDARKIERMGIPDMYVSHGSREWQLKQAGIDTDALITRIRSLKA